MPGERPTRLRTVNDHPALPTGTVTFLFTDIEGSTRLLSDLGDGYEPVWRIHAELLREAIADHDGVEVSTEGDAFFAVFSSAQRATQAVVAAQRALAAASWPEDATVRVRMGMHTGEGRLGGDDYAGIDVNRAARIAAAGHGGQVLISDATCSLVRDTLPEGVTLRDLGHHRLKDLPAAERIWQLEIEGLEADFPQLRSLEAPGARLPAVVSSFVGRAEVEAVAELLATTRLLTLTGPGGTGKTRLSIRVASEVAPRFADGAFFVELDAVTEPELVASEIASTLSLTSGSRPPLERVVEHLRDRNALLVIDNLEQVIDAAPDIARIVRDCPAVSVLVTSRIPLRVSGEQEFPVPALAVPPPDERLDPERVAEFEAVRLFVERARAARPGFQLDADNVAFVADIVGRLDGLPLAIELAAARMRSLSAEALARRLDSGLGVLTGGARDAPERQRTLRAAIEWSHGLLDASDQRIFARFSVMAGGALLDQAEPVCGSRDELGRDVFEGLDSLHDQSLVLTAASDDGSPRYSMLATIREYAGERLGNEADTDEIHARHARAYLALAEEAAPHLLGPDGARWNDRLEVEHDNLRAALDRIVADDAAELGLRMIAALWRFWQVRGHLHEAAERVHAVLALPSVKDQPAELRAKGETAAGGIGWWRSDLKSTHRHYAAALALAREAGDQALLAEATYNAAFVPEPDEPDPLRRFIIGRPLLEEALELYRELDDERGVASCLWALAYAAAVDDIEGTIELGSQSLEIARRVGDLFLTGWSARLVGQALAKTGRYDEAARAFTEALDIWTDAGDKSGILLLVTSIAVLADMRGRPQRRWQLVGAAERLRIETGTDLVSQRIEPLGVVFGVEPTTEEQRAWFEEGKALSIDEVVALAREELAESG